jgi:hypothetical protein
MPPIAVYRSSESDASKFHADFIAGRAPDKDLLDEERIAPVPKALRVHSTPSPASRIDIFTNQAEDLARFLDRFCSPSIGNTASPSSGTETAVDVFEMDDERSGTTRRPATDIHPSAPLTGCFPGEPTLKEILRLPLSVRVRNALERCRDLIEQRVGEREPVSREDLLAMAYGIGPGAILEIEVAVRTAIDSGDSSWRGLADRQEEFQRDISQGYFPGRPSTEEFLALPFPTWVRPIIDHHQDTLRQRGGFAYQRGVSASGDIRECTGRGGRPACSAQSPRTKEQRNTR